MLSASTTIFKVHVKKKSIIEVILLTHQDDLWMRRTRGYYSDYSERDKLLWNCKSYKTRSVFFHNHNSFFKIECFFYMYLEFTSDVFLFIYPINLNPEIICNARNSFVNVFFSIRRPCTNFMVFYNKVFRLQRKT